MGTELTAARNNIYQEETDYKSAISEQLLSKIGASINFINNNNFLIYDFKFLGPFKPLDGGEDSAVPMISDIEIVGISFRLRDCGTSGNTTIDLHKINTSGTDAGSIFTNKIIVNADETNQKGFFVNFIANTNNDVDESASQLPTMSDANRNIDAGESLRVDIDGVAEDARDLGLFIHYRPR